MPYAPGINDISGQIRAQGRVGGVASAMAGFNSGMDAYQKQKDEAKEMKGQVDATRKMIESMAPLLEAEGLDPKVKQGLMDLGMGLNNANTPLRQQAAAATAFQKQFPTLLNAGLQKMQIDQQARDKEAQRALAAQIAELRAQQGGVPTEALRNTDEIMRAEVQAGQLNPNDPVALAKRRAELLGRGGRNPTPGQIYQMGSPVTDANGNYMGHTRLNQESGKLEVVKPESLSSGESQGGTAVGGLRPTTTSSLGKGVLDGGKFLALRNKVTDDELAVRRMSDYLGNVEKAPQGLETFATRFTTAFTTLFNSGKLSEEQVAQAIANGELQGLLGANRLEIVGGGVLTEQDALRVIARLGGEPGALRNKEIVKAAIKDLYRDKLIRYERDVEDYNIQVKSKYGSDGYKPIEPVKIDPKLFLPGEKEDESDPQVIQKKIQELRAELNKRLSTLKKQPAK
jgi:hypothetical protein